MIRTQIRAPLHGGWWELQLLNFEGVGRRGRVKFGWELSGQIDRFIGYTEHLQISHCNRQNVESWTNL